MIGVAISTQNRRDVLNQSLTYWRTYLPKNAVLVIVDDASDEPVPRIDDRRVRVIRNGYRRGVAMTKNRGIAALMDAGVDHLFLADDDVWPLCAESFAPYIESPERHLSYQWPDGSAHWEVFRDDRHFAIAKPRGVLLYATRDVIDAVGGMNPAFGAYGLEHIDFSNRVHTAGLTSHPYMDVAGSDALWHAIDRYDNSTTSTLSLIDRRWLVASNQQLLDYRCGTFVPYREGGGAQSYDLGPRLGDTYEATLDHVLTLRPHGSALEFGVGGGHSLRRIAKHMFAYGFDSFKGLPERWRDGFDAGMFACEEPDIPNVHLVRGLFSDTVPLFELGPAGPIGLVHLDADLYSSTATVLEGLDHGHVFTPGTYVVFDEWHGYPGCEMHEQLAWREFVERTGIAWQVIGHGPEQWAIRIT